MNPEFSKRDLMVQYWNRLTPDERFDLVLTIFDYSSSDLYQGMCQVKFSEIANQDQIEILLRIKPG